jgi:hypothetical protein
MAPKKKSSSVSASSSYKEKPKKSRPGIHSKNNSSKSKNATNYVKSYNGQGR